MFGGSGAFGGIRIGMGTEKFGENLPQYHHKSHITGSVLEPGPLPCRVDD
jgi:hypothetical protein